ncbi:TAP-like protein [Nonomuraea fuscirosea]|uniref:TAP-like protein n=1 Tax=Nonomuraea fuscirosea TaxID=1291556 RepID=A0A2T0MVD2_9ACTN|nr:TAP-like protein [Nonomuraea fuscirosea]
MEGREHESSRAEARDVRFFGAQTGAAGPVGTPVVTGPGVSGPGVSGPGVNGSEVAGPVAAGSRGARPWVSPSPPPSGGLVNDGSGVVWRGCGDGLECAKLAVPVDWAAPRGPRTEVDVARMPARDPARSLGPLVVNVGEGSTLQSVRARPDAVSELARWFDVVFVEGRGIGDRGSAAMVRCSVPPPDPRRIQLAPGPAAWRAYARDNAAYDRSCRLAAGPAYAGLTSWQVAHDLDALRAALGQHRLRYFGNAYGAVYGRAYAELFPRRVGRMYLEGLPDHPGTGLGRRLIAHARAAERRLSAFSDWCANQPGCPLADDDAVAVLDDLLERAPSAANPSGRLGKAGPGHGAGVVSGYQVVAAVLAGLTPERWPELARALSAAEAGDLSALAAMASVTRPAEPGTVARSTWCHDFMPVVPGYRRFLAMESRLRAVAPRVGWLTGRHEIARCLGLRPLPPRPPHAATPVGESAGGPGDDTGDDGSVVPVTAAGGGGSVGQVARGGEGSVPLLARAGSEGDVVPVIPGSESPVVPGAMAGAESPVSPVAAEGGGSVVGVPRGGDGFVPRVAMAGGEGAVPPVAAAGVEGSVVWMAPGGGGFVLPLEMAGGEGSVLPGTMAGGEDSMVSVAAGGRSSVLVGIGRLDAGNPPAAAARAARRIPGARVLWHGDGQDAYLLQGAGKLRAACLRARVHDYLVNGVLPRPRTLCPGELTAGRFH